MAAAAGDATFAEWLARVERELGATDAVDELSSRPVGGPVVRPLYVEEDRPATGGRPLPSSRGRRLAVRLRGCSAEELAAAVRAAIGGGASALRLPEAAARTVGTLERILAEAPLDGVSVTVESGGDGLPTAAILLAWLDRQGGGRDEPVLNVGADPLATLVAGGSLPRPAERHLAELGALAVACDAELPSWRTIEARGAPYHEAGADDAQELGIVLAASVAYLRALEGAGLPPERAGRQIGWSLSQGRDLFLQIAKLRAARLLWQRLQRALGTAEPSPLFLHAAGSRRSLTRYGRWVNLLRGTTQAAAALLGGADEIDVEPFDAALGEISDRAARLARNTLHVLEEESALGAIGDPAGGSYYVEALTEELARTAWETLRAIEAEGGLLASLETGALQGRIHARARERLEEIARRREPITGVSEYADLAEEPPVPAGDRPPAPPPARDPAGATKAAADADPVRTAAAGREPPLDGAWLGTAAVAAGAGLDRAGLAARLGGDGPGASVESLSPQRDAEPFEALRDAAAAEDAIPTLFLATLGPPSRHGARSLFATRALAAGGVAGLEGEGTGAEAAEAAATALARAFAASGLRAACLCGDDEHYRALGAATVAALKGAGASPLWVAVPPGELADALRAAGADEILYRGCDLVERLRSLHTALGIRDGRP